MILTTPEPADLQTMVADEELVVAGSQSGELFVWLQRSGTLVRQTAVVSTRGRRATAEAPARRRNTTREAAGAAAASTGGGGGERPRQRQALSAGVFAMTQVDLGGRMPGGAELRPHPPASSPPSAGGSGAAGITALAFMTPYGGRGRLLVAGTDGGAVLFVETKDWTVVDEVPRVADDGINRCADAAPRTAALTHRARCMQSGCFYRQHAAACG
jgi:hypothetical protein